MPESSSGAAVAQRVLGLMIRACTIQGLPGAPPPGQFLVSNDALATVFEYLLRGLDIASDRDKVEYLLQRWERNIDLFRANLLRIVSDQGTVTPHGPILIQDRVRQVLELCPPIDLG
jgi:hypothetical protein